MVRPFLRATRTRSSTSYMRVCIVAPIQISSAPSDSSSYSCRKNVRSGWSHPTTHRPLAFTISCRDMCLVLVRLDPDHAHSLVNEQFIQKGQRADDTPSVTDPIL